MKLAALCLGGAILLALLFFWAMSRIHFRIGSRHLKVMLFGLPIRRIALNDIAYASKREPKGTAERWYSTLKTSHRILVIERKSGLFKHVCITPQNRYVFLADLKAAVRRVDPGAEWAALRSLDTSHLHKAMSDSAAMPEVIAPPPHAQNL